MFCAATWLHSASFSCRRPYTRHPHLMPQHRLPSSLRQHSILHGRHYSSCSVCGASHALAASPTLRWQCPGRRLQPHELPPQEQPPSLGAQALLRPQMPKLAAAHQQSFWPVRCPTTLRTRSSQSLTMQLDALPACYWEPNPYNQEGLHTRPVFQHLGIPLQTSM